MSRTIRAPRGASISCKGWQQEAALRMLMNNLDPEVAVPQGGLRVDPLLYFLQIFNSYFCHGLSSLFVNCKS